MLLVFLFYILFIFIVGVCIGSFLNVVILRALSGESIVFPASKCPKCQHALKWYHNIPVLSYLFLRGKCAFCGEKISIQYPMVELLTGIIFLLLFFKYGLGIQLLFLWLFSAIFIVLAMTDLKEKVIFTRHAYFLIVGGLLYHLYPTVLTHNFSILLSSVLGIILGIIIMEALARVGYLFAGTRAFGEGDTYIAAGMGAVFGYYVLIYALILAVIVQLIITVPIVLYKLIRQKDYVSIISFLVFFIAIYLNKLVIVPYILSVILLILSGGYLCYRLLKDLRSDEDRIYLPFGPAMIIASFVLIFFM